MISKKKDKVIYEENINGRKIKGTVGLQTNGNALISSTQHKFQIKLEKDSMCARFKGANGKFGKSIPLKRLKKSTNKKFQRGTSCSVSAPPRSLSRSNCSSISDQSSLSS